MKFKYSILAGFALVAGAAIMSSCNESDPNIKQTNAEAFAGEWFVTVTVDGTDINGGYGTVITSNTAANVSTEILVSDLVDPNGKPSFAGYKVKAQSDIKAMSFNADKVLSTIPDYNDTMLHVSIANGKIFPKGGMSKSKVVVDSIYFELQLEDDTPSPYGTTYVVSGHKRTGFTEDEY